MIHPLPMQWLGDFPRILNFLKRTQNHTLTDRFRFISKKLRQKLNAATNAIVPLRQLLVVRRRLLSREISTSITHIKRLRERLGYRKTTTKYCHTIRDVNKVARMDFCAQMLDGSAAFFPTVFSLMKALYRVSSIFCYVKKGNHYARMRSRAKHPVKVHIWGGISTRGTTQLAILPEYCGINSEIYCRILEQCYLPYANRAHNGFARLVQDNAPAHKSRYTLETFTEWGIETLYWPAESPDLNPIELVWGNMKIFIRKRGVKNIDDLKIAIIQYWNSLLADVCKNYIAGIRKRMERVIEQEGRNITEGK